MMEGTKISFLVLLIFSTCNLSQGSNLKAVQSKTKLPHHSGGRLVLKSIYDGDDSIFIVNANSANQILPQILRFNLTDETLSIHATINSAVIRNPLSVFMDELGNFFFLGYGKQIHKYDSNSNVTSLVTSTGGIGIKTHVQYNSSAQEIFMIGDVGRNRHIQSFDMSSLTVQTLKNEGLDFNMTIDLFFPLSEDKVLMRGSYTSFGDAYTTTFTLHLPTLHSEEIPSTFIADVLRLKYKLAIVPAAEGQDFSYVIGGNHPWETKYPYRSGLLKMDPSSLEFELLPVNDFPGDNANSYWIPPSTTYVGKLNRIYCFGGRMLNTVFSDDIYYIDLN